MAKIDDILRDVDILLEKKASVKSEVHEVAAEDDIVKLANLLLSEDTHLAKALGAENTTPLTAAEGSWNAKLASALVISELLGNLDKFQKMEAFEKHAQESGYSQVEIDKFIVEKFL